MQENRIRNDLTGAERKAFAADVGRLCLKLQEKSKQNGESSLDNNWILDFADKSGLSKATAHNWWSAFCKESGLSIPTKSDTRESTAARLATDYKVSAPTIKRDGQFAEAVDTLASACGRTPPAVSTLPLALSAVPYRPASTQDNRHY